MKIIKKSKNIKKRTYSKPQIERIKLDNEISMVMMSPPGDPNGSIQPEHFSINPFKIPKF
jgi:secreted Zn-dependent insulinase-like peptidase